MTELNVIATVGCACLVFLSLTLMFVADERRKRARGVERALWVLGFVAATLTTLFNAALFGLMLSITAGWV